MRPSDVEWRAPHEPWTVADLCQAARIAVSRVRGRVLKSRDAYDIAWEGCALASCESPNASWCSVVDAGERNVLREEAGDLHGFIRTLNGRELAPHTIIYWDRRTTRPLGVPDLEPQAVRQVLESMSPRGRQVLLARAASHDLTETADLLGLSLDRTTVVVSAARREALALLYDHEPPPKLRIDKRLQATVTCRNGHPWSANAVIYRVADGSRMRKCRGCMADSKARRKEAA